MWEVGSSSLLETILDTQTRATGMRQLSMDQRVAPRDRCRKDAAAKHLAWEFAKDNTTTAMRSRRLSRLYYNPDG